MDLNWVFIGANEVLSIVCFTSGTQTSIDFNWV